MNHYDTLGVGKDATADDIKAAYRKQAKAHHPDREGGDEVKMQAVNEAYEVLQDPVRRERYDRTGHDEATKDPTVAAAQIMQELYRAVLNQDKLQRGNIKLNLKRMVSEREQALILQQYNVRERLEKLRLLTSRCKEPTGVMSGLLASESGRLQSSLESAQFELLALEEVQRQLNGFEDLKPEPDSSMAARDLQSQLLGNNLFGNNLFGNNLFGDNLFGQGYSNPFQNNPRQR